jgi:hypothetical protein
MTIMNKWTDFQDYCATQGIPHEITANAYEFTDSEFYGWNVERKEAKNKLCPTFDFGKDEYQDLVTVKQGIQTIKSGVMSELEDYDSRGRSLAQVRLKQLLKKSNKHLNYRVCKTYYLWLGNHFGTAGVDDKGVWAFQWLCAETYDTCFATIWNKHLAKQTA